MPVFRLPDLRTRLAANKEECGRALASREVRRIAPQWIVTHDAHCMAYCLGLDNRDLLPPFAPVGRNEDGLFGDMLALADPRTLFAHLPYGVIHDSDRPAAYGRGYMPSATQTRACELVQSIVRMVSSSTFAESPADRLGQLGQALVDLGGMRPPVFASFLVDLTLTRMARQFGEIEAAVLGDSGTPAFFRAAFRRYRAAFHRSVSRPDFFVPIEFRDRGSIEAGYQALQAYLRDFGELLQAWPTLWAFAAHERLGESIPCR